MVLAYLYRLGLEPERVLWMHIGCEGPTNPPRVSIYMLHAYVEGFLSATRLADEGIDDYGRFIAWLRDDKHDLPAEGWDHGYLVECGGDHGAAIRKFLGYVKEYAAETRPKWFYELNAAPLPSLVHRGTGEPMVPDVRLPDHVALAVATTRHSE